MTTKTALFALLAMWGVSSSLGTPALAEEAASAEAMADVYPASVTATDLHLQLTLGSDKVDEHYVAATVPYVCPDMPKE